MFKDIWVLIEIRWKLFEANLNSQFQDGSMQKYLSFARNAIKLFEANLNSQFQVGSVQKLSSQMSPQAGRQALFLWLKPHFSSPSPSPPPPPSPITIITKVKISITNQPFCYSAAPSAAREPRVATLSAGTSVECPVPAVSLASWWWWLRLCWFW